MVWLEDGGLAKRADGILYNAGLMLLGRSLDSCCREVIGRLLEMGIAENDIL